MKAIQFLRNSSEAGAAVDVELPRPEAGGHDLLVKIEAIAMNPVDYKVRPAEGADPKVLGFDAAGTVVGVGEACSLFQEGDEVFFAGDVTRPGTNSEFQLVDERIVAKCPSSLDATASAALPLTALTAWESLRRNHLAHRFPHFIDLIKVRDVVHCGHSQLLQLLRHVAVMIHDLIRAQLTVPFTTLRT